MENFGKFIHIDEFCNKQDLRMYRLKNDKRVTHSAENIRSGLLKCLKNKKLEDISVSDIASASGVSRGTFYRIFDTPTDVLSYTCDNLIRQAVKEYSKRRINSRDKAAEYLIEFWLQHCEFLEIIFMSRRIDILHKAHEKYIDDIHTPDMAVFSNDELDYLGATSAAVFSSILYVWIKHGKKESVPEIVALYKKFLKEV